jgi:hypothetical protein
MLSLSIQRPLAVVEKMLIATFGPLGLRTPLTAN